VLRRSSVRAGIDLVKKKHLFAQVTERRVGVAVIGALVVAVVEGWAGQGGGAVAQIQ
jgi:hypothetical protein